MMRNHLLVISEETGLLTQSLLLSQEHPISDCDPFLAVLNSGLTTYQCITPWFIILQFFKESDYCLSSFFLLVLFPIISQNTCLVFVRLDFFTFKKTNQIISTSTTILIYILFAWKVRLTVFCRILFIFLVSWHILLNHFLFEFLSHLDSA